MKCAYSSNIGAKRNVNQDSYLAANIEKDGEVYYIFAVADGLGGHRSGEVASKLAIDKIKEKVMEIDDYTDYAQANAFVNQINREIIREGVLDPEQLGMATTLTMAIVHGNHMVIYHVGDSRAYRITGSGIERLTKDHSLVQALIDRGRITPDEAKTHPQKNIITRALGTDESIKTDLFEYKLYPGDEILLCSDGLYNMVPEDEIQKLVMENTMAEATRKLVNLANHNGGTDNITVIVFAPNFEDDEVKEA